MVSYSDPCSVCGNKRRRSILERSPSCPIPRSVQSPPSVKFARSTSAPIPSAVESPTTPYVNSDLAAVPNSAPWPPPSLAAAFPAFFHRPIPDSTVKSGGAPSSRSPCSCTVSPPSMAGSFCPVVPNRVVSPLKQVKLEDEEVEEKKVQVEVGLKEEEEEKKKEKEKVMVCIKCKCGVVSEIILHNP